MQWKEQKWSLFKYLIYTSKAQAPTRTIQFRSASDPLTAKPTVWVLAGARALFPLSIWISFHTQPCLSWLLTLLTSAVILQDELSIPFPQQHNHNCHLCLNPIITVLFLPRESFKSAININQFFHLHYNNFPLAFIGPCHLILLSIPAKFLAKYWGK